MTHEIKLIHSFAKPVLTGEKCFEIRENDRGYQKGDRIRFMVVGIQHPSYEEDEIYKALESKVYEVTYVISGWGLKNGHVAFGIREVENDG